MDGHDTNKQWTGLRDIYLRYRKDIQTKSEQTAKQPFNGTTGNACNFWSPTLSTEGDIMILWYAHENENDKPSKQNIGRLWPHGHEADFKFNDLESNQCLEETCSHNRLRPYCLAATMYFIIQRWLSSFMSKMLLSLNNNSSVHSFNITLLIIYALGHQKLSQMQWERKQHRSNQARTKWTVRRQQQRR